MQRAASPHDGFLRRAQAEAARYGDDPWVFIRELGQNARDAGAERIDIKVRVADGSLSLIFEDDGCGMSMEHARRYFFRLYASSKESEQGAAGRYGVGFWSVLRFGAQRLEVHSYDGRDAWGLSISGDLSLVEELKAARVLRGTRLVFFRALKHDEDEAEIRRGLRQAVERYLIHLRCRGRRGSPLPVWLDGESMQRPFRLDFANQQRFKVGKAEGMVGLGRRPSYRLFARGLPVVEGNYLEELEGRKSPRRGKEAEGIAPVFLLNSDELEVVLSRRRVVRDRNLERLLSLARLSLEELVDGAIDGSVEGGGRFSRLRSVFSLVIRRWRRARPVAAIGLLLALLATVGGLAGGLLAWRLADRDESPAGVPASVRQAPIMRLDEEANRVLRPVRQAPIMRLDEKASRVSRPEAPSRGPEPGWALQYSPKIPVLFRLSLLETFDPRRGWQVGPIKQDWGPLQGRAEAHEDRLRVHLSLESKQGPWSLPVASGYRPVAGSALLNEVPVRLLENSQGLLRLVLEGRYGEGANLTYSLVERPEMTNLVSAPRPAGVAPPTLQMVLEQTARVDPEKQAKHLSTQLRHLLRYEQSESLALVYAQALAEEDPNWLEIVFDSGAGDCDVLNGVLAWSLRRLGRPARLVAGIVGSEGRGKPGLHAWVETEVAGRHQNLDISDATSDASPSWGRDRPVIAVATNPLPETNVVYNPGNRAPIGEGQAGEGQAGEGQAREGQVREGTPLLLLFLGAAFLACCLLLYWLLKSPMSGMRLSEGPKDRHALVAGMALDALRRPAAWREVPGIWRRAILPTMNGGRISLARLLDMAELGQAFSASPGNELLAAARVSGAIVVDPEAPSFGRVYRAMSGMRSLDAMLAWCPTSTGPAEARLLEEITSLLKGAGLASVCRAVRPGEETQVFRWMDLAPLRPVDESIWPRHFVAVVIEHPWWCHLLEHFARAPHWALLAASDRLAAEAGLDATVAQNLRRKAAEQAISAGLRSEERTQP